VRTFAERKVDDLSYQGFENIMAYLQTSLHMPIKNDPAVFTLVKEAIEVRNIIIHNGGRVNRLFLRRTKRTDLPEGALFPLELDYALTSGKAMLTLVEELDEVFVRHFRLQFPPKEQRSPDERSGT